MKKLIIFIIILIIVLCGIVSIIFIKQNNSTNNKSDEIKDNYYAVLCKGSGEILYNTYLYIEDNKYTYIKTTAITESWGSSQWIEKITDTGSLKEPKEIVEIANKKQPAQWVRLNVNIPKTSNNKEYKKNDIITIDELMNLLSTK